MSLKRVKLTFDGKAIEAETGAILLDALLEHGVDVPYGCRAGACQSCKLVDKSNNQTILACQAQVETAQDLTIPLEAAIPAKLITARVQGHFLVLTLSSAFCHEFFQYIQLEEEAGQGTFSGRVISTSRDPLTMQVPINIELEDVILNQDLKWYVRSNYQLEKAAYALQNLPLDSSPIYVIVRGLTPTTVACLVREIRDICQSPIELFLLLSNSGLHEQYLAECQDLIKGMLKVQLSHELAENELEFEGNVRKWLLKQKVSNFLFSRSSCVIVADDFACDRACYVADESGLSSQRTHIYNMGVLG